MARSIEGFLFPMDKSVFLYVGYFPRWGACLYRGVTLMHMMRYIDKIFLGKNSFLLRQLVAVSYDFLILKPHKLFLSTGVRFFRT